MRDDRGRFLPVGRPAGCTRFQVRRDGRMQALFQDG
jgi:hypothetical protein